MAQTKTQPNKTIIREPLRWLFLAEYADGSKIEQTQEDKCLTRTDGTGSAFTDVLAKGDPISFSLINGNDEEFVTVDLLTGAFIVNGTPLIAHEQNLDPSKHKLRLVYFRETRVDQNVSEKGEVIETFHYTNRYFIGWQATINGKNKQVTLAVG